MERGLLGSLFTVDDDTRVTVTCGFYKTAEDIIL